MLIYTPLFHPFCAFIFSLAGTWIALGLLRNYQVMDVPDERSNHTRPVPRGGAIAMIIAILLFLLSADIDPKILVAGILLAAVSFADDLKGQPVWLRIIAQFIAISVAISVLPGRLFPMVVPQNLEWAFIVLAWMWFINLTNFMDGIDGLSAMQVIIMAEGICLLHIFNHAVPFSLALYASIIAAATFAFYFFNRSPAKLFMGDVGSITLGFLMGFMLLSVAFRGQWMAALILPAYYMTDATITLIQRLKRGEKIWQAHSLHAYQQAVRSGLTHTQVTRRISILNTVLVLLAIGSMKNLDTGLIMLIVAYALSAWLMYRFKHVTAS